MARWSYALGGLIAWTVHFSGLYAFASLEAQTLASDALLWRGAAVALTLACATACLVLAAAAARRLRRGPYAAERLMDQLARLGALMALPAIAWQTLAMLIV